MRKPIVPDPSVTAAWQELNELVQRFSGMYNVGNQNVSNVGDYLTRERYNKGVAEARVIFFTIVAQYHGPKTVIEWTPNNNFILWSSEPVASASANAA